MVNPNELIGKVIEYGYFNITPENGREYYAPCDAVVRSARTKEIDGEEVLVLSIRRIKLREYDDKEEEIKEDKRRVRVRLEPRITGSFGGNEALDPYSQLIIRNPSYVRQDGFLLGNQRVDLEGYWD